MTLIPRKTGRPAHIAAAIALAAVLVSTPGASMAQSANSASPSGLVGTWLVLVTLRNCDTQAPLGPPFMSLVTFHRGGTLSESTAAPGFAVGQRTPGHGTWSHLGGSTYLQRVVSLITFDTPPVPPFGPAFYAGWQTITHTVEQVSADQVTSSGTNTFYKATGEAYLSGCSTAVAQRFE